MPIARLAPVADNFDYGAPAGDAAGLGLSLSIFADRAHLRGELREDGQSAGFRIAEVAALDALRDGAVRPLGEVVLLDCPVVDGAVLASLARIDLRAAHAGAMVIVSTSLAALDDVFACLDQSRPQILVDPGRAERLIALGQVLARLPGRRVRELSEEDRLVLLRLSEQVALIAERMEGLRPQEVRRSPAGPPAQDGASPLFRFTAAATGAARQPAAAQAGDQLVRPALPDPRLMRRIIRQRQMRARFFDAELFADPAWDMLLDLTAARAEKSRVSVTSLCIASGVPPTTALRWIGQMTEAGLLQRHEDETDRRRAFITLTEKAAMGMADYFAELGEAAMSAV
ncbi:MAG: winged helix DNA-binding protein [Sphingomonadales bacterium]|nr:winged helix DNA-binding protein [Sphingomonadales bacterium]